MAGYPEAHPDNIVDDPEKMKENYWKELEYLHAKVSFRAMLLAASSAMPAKHRRKLEQQGRCSSASAGLL